VVADGRDRVSSTACLADWEGCNDRYWKMDWSPPICSCRGTFETCDINAGGEIDGNRLGLGLPGPGINKGVCATDPAKVGLYAILPLVLCAVVGFCCVKKKQKKGGDDSDGWLM